MWSQAGIVAIVGLLMFGFGVQTASAQTKTDEASHQSSRMAPPSGNTGAANNGVGTDGSLDHNAGTASSTVAGQKGGKKPYGAMETKPATGGAMETDPNQGGGKPH